MSLFETLRSVLRFRKFELNAKEMGDMVYKSDVDGVPTQEVAKQWIADNESRWKTWVE